MVLHSLTFAFGGQVAWKDLEIQKQIGEGSFGRVFLAKWRETTVAVKQLTYTGVSGSLEDNDEFINQGMNVLLQGLEQVMTCLHSHSAAFVKQVLGCLSPSLAQQHACCICASVQVSWAASCYSWHCVELRKKTHSATQIKWHGDNHVYCLADATRAVLVML